jgi:hypothetical protein
MARAVLIMEEQSKKMRNNTWSAWDGDTDGLTIGMVIATGTSRGTLCVLV